jgi:hypothetical protein
MNAPARHLVYGRCGGRWAADETPKVGGQVHRLRCAGGPLKGLCVAMHTWGEAPSVPTELPVSDAGGRYVLDAVYRWRPDETDIEQPINDERSKR